MSPKSAGLAKKWGFKKLHVYVKGLPVWKRRYRTTTSVDYVKNGNIVLVDVRDRKAVSAGHIPRAFSIPLSTLKNSKALFPKAKGTPIILYSDTAADVDAARKIMKTFKYKTVVGFYDGLNVWKQAGNKLNRGPALMASAKNPIKYKKNLGQGEISISDFEKSLKSNLIFMVDARTPEEYSAGHFPGSVSIPLEQMQKRMNEIPKDKFIVVHCKTGGRGEIGYRLLKEKGYSVKFLNAECACKTTGEYEIW
jgi:rhodanese-related sulfurtransferase